jgi:hypothetical protein
MKLSRLHCEFLKVKADLGLSELRFCATKPGTLTYFDNPGCIGIYIWQYDWLVMRNGHLGPETLKCMLHEVCHAIQHREGRLKVPEHNYRRKYALEIEAEVFARTEYRHRYEEEFGSLSEWDLADFESYKRFFKKQEMGTCSTMTAEQLYGFVKGLKGATKKPIVQRVKRNSKVEDWQYSLARICV